MSDVKTAAQAVAEQLHREICLPGSNPYHRYSERHRDGHTQAAERMLAGLALDGYHLNREEQS